MGVVGVGVVVVVVKNVDGGPCYRGVGGGWGGGRGGSR